MKYMQVKGENGLVRDPNSGAILNINSTEIQQARKRKKLWREQQEKAILLESEVSSLKEEITEIKGMLKQILEVTNGNHNN